MTNPLNLAKHEIAEMLADADEVAHFLSEAVYDPTSSEPSALILIDKLGDRWPIEQQQLARWQKSIHALSRMVEIEE